MHNDISALTLYSSAKTSMNLQLETDYYIIVTVTVQLLLMCSVIVHQKARLLYTLIY